MTIEVGFIILNIVSKHFLMRNPSNLRLNNLFLRVRKVKLWQICLTARSTGDKITVCLFITALVFKHASVLQTEPESDLCYY